MTATEIEVEAQGHVASIRILRPPHNFIETSVVADIADALEDFDRRDDIRVVILRSSGKNFCAGANFAQHGSRGVPPGGRHGRHLYKEALRLFGTAKPIIAEVQGAAIGAGLGLALAADFRVTCPEGRFSANFTRLGFHPGFGLTCTLPRLVGAQKAALLLYSGRRISGNEAADIGLVDFCVAREELALRAEELAAEIAQSAPLAVMATRETLRRGLADEVARATEREFNEWDWLRNTEDFKEGIAAMDERRPPSFRAR